VFLEDRQEIWTIGGFPWKYVGINTDNVFIYSLTRDEWSTGPALPTSVHHIFNAAFVHENTIIVLGGINEMKPSNVIYSLDLNDIVWTGRNATVGGMVHCSDIYQGVYYCHISTTDFLQKTDIFNHFITFNPKTFHIEELAVPLVSSHVHLFVHESSGTIYMTNGRGSTCTMQGQNAQVYSLAKNEWSVVDDSAAAVSTGVPMETYAPVRFPNSSHKVLLFGGQNTFVRRTSSVILLLDLRTSAVVLYNHMPVRFFGAVIVPLYKKKTAADPGPGPDEKHTTVKYRAARRDVSDELHFVIICGSRAYGAHFTRDVFDWHFQPHMSHRHRHQNTRKHHDQHHHHHHHHHDHRHQSSKTSQSVATAGIPIYNNTMDGMKFKVVAAFYDQYDVTDALIRALASGVRSFEPGLVATRELLEIPFNLAGVTVSSMNVVLQYGNVISTVSCVTTSTCHLFV
jgi:hypothetical protein